MVYEADDLAGELLRYAEGLEGDPGALEATEERLAVLERLERKHGGTIADVLAHAERCRERRDELAGAEVALERGVAELEAARAEQAKAAGELAARGRRPRRGWRAPCASAWPSSRWRARASRSPWRSARPVRPAPTPSSS